MSKSLLDLMPDEEREKALARAKKRQEKNRARKGLDVSPELFLVAKAGDYWAWEAIMTVRRGYTIEPDLDDQGNLIYKKSIFTLEELTLLLEAADKVRHSQQVEQIHAGVISHSYSSSSKSFDNAIKPFIDRAKVAE